MKIGFFEIRGKEEEYLKKHLVEHELSFSNKPLNAHTLPRDIEILSTHSNSKVSKEVIENLSHLKLIVTRTTGFDHIDVEAAKSRNIVVCNIPLYGESTVAEFAFALILSISRKIPPAVERVKKIKKFDFSSLQGFDLKGRMLGVIGTGKIGKHAIAIAKGFGMHVIAHDAFPNIALSSDLHFGYVSLEELLKASDIITIHVPNLSSTRHLINMENIRLVKRGAVLINTARGEVVENSALAYALDEGIISFCGLDVLEDEYLLKEGVSPQDQAKLGALHNLIQRGNVFVTPHNAFNTKEAEERILKTTVENIKSFLNGNPQNTV